MIIIPQTMMMYFEAGLPEIFGIFAGLGLLNGGGDYPLGTDIASGAFHSELAPMISGDFDTGNRTDTADDERLLSFKASRCSPVYGCSHTVQPSAAAINYFIRAK